MLRQKPTHSFNLSTTFVSKQLTVVPEVKEPVPTPPDAITLDLTPEIRETQIAREMFPLPNEDEKEEILPEELLERFNKLTDAEGEAVNYEEKRAIQLYKLFFMEMLRIHLEKKYNTKKFEEEQKKKEAAKKKEQKNKVWRALTVGFFVFLLIIGFLQDGLGSFLYGQSLLSLIPGITQKTLFGASIVFGLLNTILLCTSKANSLKDDIGLTELGGSADCLFQLHNCQIDTTQRINQLLIDTNVTNRIPTANYENYALIARRFNQDILAKKPLFKHYEEPFSKKGFRWLMSTFGTFMVISGSYFMAKSLLNVIAASLIGHPAGWLLIGISVATSLIFYFAQANTMMGFLNPDHEKFKLVKEKIECFQEKTSEDFMEVLGNKKIKDKWLEENMDLKDQLVKEKTKRVEDFRKRLQRAPTHLVKQSLLRQQTMPDMSDNLLRVRKSPRGP